MAGSIPRPFIDDLIARVDIVDIVGARITLRKTGGNYSAPCPFHNEKQPSFSVSQTKQFYYCFGCGAHGNVIGFLMEYDHLGFVDAVEALASHAGLEIPREAGQTPAPKHDDLYDLMKRAARFYQQQLRTAENHEQAITYLKDRGLSGIIAKRFGIGLAPPKWDALWSHIGKSGRTQNQLISAGLLIRKEQHCYDRFRDRIMFPIRDQRGRVIGFGGRVLHDKDTPKYLNSPESPIFHKGGELYGIYEFLETRKKSNQIIVVEGYLDVISLAQNGVDNAVATLGTATSTKHLQKLTRHFQEIVFCFDGDNAGKVAAWRALEAALPMMRDGIQVFFTFLPEGDDPDSLIRREGQRGFLDAVNNALSLSDFFFQHLGDKINLETPDGRARLSQLANPLLNKMPNGIFKQLLFERLAKIVKMEVETVKSLMAQKHKKEEQPRQAHPTTPTPSSIQLALMLLVQNPALANSIKDVSQLKKLTKPETKILNQLVDLIQKNKTCTTGALLEYWRDKEEAEVFARLAATNHVIPIDGIEAEFQGALNRLIEQDQQYSIERLLEKAAHAHLSVEERDVLNALIKNGKNRNTSERECEE